MLGKSPHGVWLHVRTFSIIDLRSGVRGYVAFQFWVLVPLVASGGSAWSASAGEFLARLLTTLVAANGLVVICYVCIWFVRAWGCWLLLEVGAVSSVWRSLSPTLSPFSVVVFFSEEGAVTVDTSSVSLLVRRLLHRRRCVHLVPLLYMGFGLNECTRSQFLLVGGDIIHLLSRTTVLVVANSSSCRRLGNDGPVCRSEIVILWAGVDDWVSRKL